VVPAATGHPFPRLNGIPLCQNCVTCPEKPGASTSIYEETRVHIVVVGSR